MQRALKMMCAAALFLALAFAVAGAHATAIVDHPADSSVAAVHAINEIASEVLRRSAEVLLIAIFCPAECKPPHPHPPPPPRPPNKHIHTPPQ